MPEASQPVPAVLLTGTVGVGKTAVAREIGELLRLANVPHAVVDLDTLGQVSPTTEADGFGQSLVHRNLAAIWPNYLAHGIARLVLARVVFSRRDLDGYRAALPGAELSLARIVAPSEAVERRVLARETGTARPFLLRLAQRLDPVLENLGLDDFVVENGPDRSITEVAREILRRLDWPSPS